MRSSWDTPGAGSYLGQNCHGACRQKHSRHVADYRRFVRDTPVLNRNGEVAPVSTRVIGRVPCLPGRAAGNYKTPKPYMLCKHAKNIA